MCRGFVARNDGKCFLKANAFPIEIGLHLAQVAWHFLPCVPARKPCPYARLHTDPLCTVYATQSNGLLEEVDLPK